MNRAGPGGALSAALARFAAALAGAGRSGALVPFVPAGGATLDGEFEVRAADGRVRRRQRASLPLPAPLLRAFAIGAPRANLPITLEEHALTVWAPAELLELQVGYRWHGFNGKRLVEWDEAFVVFAEDGGDPLALRLDQADGPVWLSHRGEGRHAFFEAAPDLATFFEALATWCEGPSAAALEVGLRRRFGEAAERLWIWRELVSRVDARR